MTRRFGIFVAAAAAAVVVTAFSAVGATAAVTLTTPYPAVAIEPGKTLEFDLAVRSSTPERVHLRVARAPKGWTTTLRGGGFAIDGVTAGPGEPPEATLEVRVPEDAANGTYRVVVNARAPSGSATLPLDLRVSEAAGGTASLTGEFTRLRGPSDATFLFRLDLENATPRETTFNLAAAGPEGWQVEARPSGEEQASTVTVEGGGTATVEVEADPPDDVAAGRYPIAVRAAGGGVEARTELEVEITGRFELSLTTPTQRLNADVRAGETSGVPLLVLNEGSAPLVGVELSATPPSDWEVEFEPETIESIKPGESAAVTARITPSEEAVAGDYMVGVEASVPEANAEIELRATVETSPLWGVLGGGLIVLALGALAWVFRRYGRR